VPKDDLRLPRLPPAALSREELARLKEGLSPDKLARLRQLEPPPGQPALASAVEFTRKQLTEQRQAITALERDLAARRQEIAAIELEIAAIELEIAGRREAARTVEEWLARGGRAPDPPRATSPPTKTPAPAPDPSPTREPEQDGHPAPGKEAEDGPQTELTRLFFTEVYSGHPSKKLGYRALRQRMKEWVAKKNEDDNGSRRVASETTIRNVRKAL
jgi:hypothetical protein